MRRERDGREYARVDDFRWDQATEKEGGLVFKREEIVEVKI